MNAAPIPAITAPISANRCVLLLSVSRDVVPFCGSRTAGDRLKIALNNRMAIQYTL
jgi:hypothetical protein